MVAVKRKHLLRKRRSSPTTAWLFGGAFDKHSSVTDFQKIKHVFYTILWLNTITKSWNKRLHWKSFQDPWRQTRIQQKTKTGIKWQRPKKMKFSANNRLLSIEGIKLWNWKHTSANETGLKTIMGSIDKITLNSKYYYLFERKISTNYQSIHYFCSLRQKKTVKTVFFN